MYLNYENETLTIILYLIANLFLRTNNNTISQLLQLGFPTDLMDGHITKNIKDKYEFYIVVMSL